VVRLSVKFFFSPSEVSHLLPNRAQPPVASDEIFGLRLTSDGSVKFFFFKKSGLKPHPFWVGILGILGILAIGSTLVHAHADCTEAIELESRVPGSCTRTRPSHACALALPPLQLRLELELLLAHHLRLLELSEGEPHGVIIALDVAVVPLEVAKHEVLEVLLHLRLVQAVAPVDLVELGRVAGPASERSEGGGGGAVRAGRARAGGGGREQVMCSPAATDFLDLYQAACGKQSNVRHSRAGWACSSLALFAGRFDVAGRKAGFLTRPQLAVLVRRHAGRRRRPAAAFAAHGEAARRFSPGPAPPFEAGVLPSRRG
jgi:hypothetical protein